MEYTRYDLISLCERAVVRHEEWNDRDSASAQRQVGELWMLLLGGCPFEVVTSGGWQTNEHTIVVTVSFRGFSSFEMGSGLNNETFYLPTQKRLDEAQGGDWY